MDRRTLDLYDRVTADEWAELPADVKRRIVAAEVAQERRDEARERRDVVDDR